MAGLSSMSKANAEQRFLGSSPAPAARGSVPPASPGPAALCLAPQLHVCELHPRCWGSAGGAGIGNPALLVFPCTVKAVNSILPPLSGTNAPQTTMKTSVQLINKYSPVPPSPAHSGESKLAGEQGGGETKVTGGVRAGRGHGAALPVQQPPHHSASPS